MHVVVESFMSTFKSRLRSTILKELFDGLQLEDTANEAGEEMDASDDNDDLILMIDDVDKGENQDDPELLQFLISKAFSESV